MQRAAVLGFSAVLVLLLGALWITREAPPPQETSAAPSPPLWASFTPDAVRAVRFVDKGEPGVTLLRSEGAWYVDAPPAPRVAAVPFKARAMVGAVAALSSIRLLEEPGPVADYGLGTSALRVHVTLADGGTRTLVVGDLLPVGEGRYVRLEDSDAVHVLPVLPLQVLLGDPLALTEPLPEAGAALDAEGEAR